MTVYDRPNTDPFGEVLLVRGSHEDVVEHLKLSHDKAKQWDRWDSYGYVYALAFQSGLLKIGRSADAKKRIKEHLGNIALYRGELPIEVAVSRQHRGFWEAEADIHRRLAGVREDREYFRCTIDDFRLALRDHCLELESDAVRRGFSQRSEYLDSLTDARKANHAKFEAKKAAGWTYNPFRAGCDGDGLHPPA